LHKNYYFQQLGEKMKNKVTYLLALGLFLFVVLGCSFGGLIGSSDETAKKDQSGKTADATTEKEPSGEVVKVGIPECDEIATYINDNSEEIEGSIIAKGIVYIYKNMILENIREGVENMSEEEKTKVAKACKKSLEDLKKNMSK
jgi:hypothetical protein